MYAQIHQFTITWDNSASHHLRLHISVEPKKLGLQVIRNQSASTSDLQTLHVSSARRRSELHFRPPDIDLSFIKMSLLQKRKAPETKPKTGGNIAESDRIVLNVIKSKREMAIFVKDLKQEAGLPDPTFNKSIKNLLTSGLVKEVAHVQLKGRKHYIAAEFEPSQEITGGSWYSKGELDQDFINGLKDLCLRIIRKLKAATADGVYDFSVKNGLINTDCTSQQISEILKSMVLDNKIIEVKSTGLGEYHSIPIGNVCYRCTTGDSAQGLRTGAMVSIPCGVCPRIRECTPDGLISPTTCVYYTKWLEF
ncbi:unnamed protein product [Lactuca virosa]|uniref:DNA-directed RNA polymerase III subunit RPC6 n=1 Tax=Lactuca virosa TaxID=75947 RepID=A0AAU9MEH3_9ASTR|nr:unnamed protein product [Lactuca virosa]CAH1424927.1 unnamed protein product [Lactuca virosa]